MRFAMFGLFAAFTLLASGCTAQSTPAKPQKATRAKFPAVVHARLSGATYRIGDQVIFLAGSDMQHINNEAELQAYFKDAVRPQNALYPSGSPKIKIEVWRLKPTPTTPAVFAKATLTTPAPNPQPAIARQNSVIDLDDTEGIPVAKVETLVWAD